MPKDPAAVALGRKSAAKQTEEQRRAFVEAARERNAKYTIAERKAIARKAAMTRRIRGPKWIAPVRDSPGSPGEPPAAAPDELTQLGRAIDEIPDDLLAELAKALSGRFA